MKVISYSLFRHSSSFYESDKCDIAGKVFYRYLPILVRAHHSIFPGWELRIHHDNSIYQEGIYRKALKRLNEVGLLKLVGMGDAHTLCGSMLWRMNPAWDLDVEVVVCRDVDSLPLPRDRRCVEEFFASGKSTHAILDSTSHSGPLMGGMLSIRSHPFRSLTGFSNWDSFKTFAQASDFDWNNHGSDQVFLNKHIEPRVRNSLFIHNFRANREINYPVSGISPEVLSQGDSLALHIGAMYDPEPPLCFYEKYCPEDILSRIRDAEAESGEVQNGDIIGWLKEI